MTILTPSSVFYSQKVVAVDGHPALLFLNKTTDGRPLYLTSVGVPYNIKGKNCSGGNYNICSHQYDQYARVTFDRSKYVA